MGARAINRTSGVLAALALALSACGGSAPAPEPSRAPGDAPTFVSLNPCIDAILVEVADPAQILALSHYSRDPAASSMDVARAAQFGVNGGTAEEVIALQPDVVLASSFIDPATKSALERVGMRVETFGSPASVADSLDQIRTLAALTGHSDAGEALVERIATSPAQPQGTVGSALLWQPGQIVAGEASLVAEHLRWAGFTNYAAERGLGQADHVTLEEILARKPRLLLVAGDSAGQRHPILQGTFKFMEIADFQPRLFYCGGPSIPLARERMLALRKRVEQSWP